MGTQWFTISLVSLFWAASAGAQAQGGSDPASDFIDTRLTFTFGDDDLFHKFGERVPISPRAGGGDRTGYELFYDNLDTRFSGRESLAHLVLYREMPAFADDVTTDAALVLRFASTQTDLRSFADSGSYLRLKYQPWLEAPDDAFSVTLFPLDSDRIRLGYLYDLSYGGSGFVGRGLLQTPAAQIRLDRNLSYYFIAVKTTPSSSQDLIDIETAETDVSRTLFAEQTQYSVLAGAGWDLFADSMRAELGGGWFQRGKLNFDSYQGQKLWTVGASARLVYHQNINITPSIDLTLYENDPDKAFRQYVPAEYVPEQLGWLVSAEGTWLRSRLANVDKSQQITTQNAFAAAARVRVHYDYLRVELTGLYRDLGFVLRNRPRADVFGIPDDAQQNAEWLVSLASDWHFPKPHLTVGASIGVRRPAGLFSPTTVGAEVLFGPPVGVQDRTTVVESLGAVTLLPNGQDVEIELAARTHVRMDLSEMLWAMLWLQYVRDPNTALILPDTEQDPHMFGAGFSAAARF